LNKLNTINAYAEAGVKKLNAALLKINTPSLTSSEYPAIIAIDATTCSFATNPCIAETVASQLNSPKNGYKIHENIFPNCASIESAGSIPYLKLNEKLNKNQTMIDASKIIDPACLINAKTFSPTSLKIYLKFGYL